MTLITAFEIITLAGVSLSLLAVVMFEIGDSLVANKRVSLGRKPLIQPVRQAVSAAAVSVVAANNQLTDLPKAA